VYDRAVVDLGADHARADDQCHHRDDDAETESLFDRSDPVGIHRIVQVAQQRQTDQQHRQGQQQPDPLAAEQASQRETHNRHVHRAVTLPATSSKTTSAKTTSSKITSSKITSSKITSSRAKRTITTPPAPS
jgi:hypothetical protein